MTKYPEDAVRVIRETVQISEAQAVNLINGVSDGKITGFSQIAREINKPLAGLYNIRYLAGSLRKIDREHGPWIERAIRGRTTVDQAYFKLVFSIHDLQTAALKAAKARMMARKPEMVEAGVNAVDVVVDGLIDKTRQGIEDIATTGELVLQTNPPQRDHKNLRKDNPLILCFASLQGGRGSSSPKDLRRT
jgi:hypothetical protein